MKPALSRPGRLQRIALLAIAIGVSCALDTVGAIQEPKEVLVLYSTRRDAQIVTVGDRELPRILENGLPEGVDYYSEFIDEGRFSEDDYQTAFREYLSLKYRATAVRSGHRDGREPARVRHRAPRRVVPGHAARVFRGSRRVACRITRTPQVSSPSANLAGTVTLATALQPDTKNIFVVIGVGANGLARGGAATASPVRAAARRHLPGRSAGRTTSKRGSARLPAHSIVYYLVVDRDGAGERFHPLEYLSRLTTIANAPVYSWVDSAMDRGIVGGSLKDQVAQTEAVGQLALQVLRGQAADSIPPVTNDLNVMQVDSRQLRRWGISESRVPAGTTIRFREPTVWDRYASLIIIAAVVVFAQSALIGGLLHSTHPAATGRGAGPREPGRGCGSSYDRIRDLGARLLNAQESERSRVARDLHDDISQQMALLEIDLEQLAGVVEEGGAGASPHETLQRAQDIGRSVHDLSHRLHPAKLRLIGLVAGLQGSAAGIVAAGIRDHVHARRVFRRRFQRNWPSASSGSCRKRCTTRSSTATAATCRLTCKVGQCRAHADHRGRRRGVRCQHDLAQGPRAHQHARTARGGRRLARDSFQAGRRHTAGSGRAVARSIP